MVLCVEAGWASDDFYVVIRFILAVMTRLNESLN